MRAKNNTHIYVAQTSNNRVIAACDLYCCVLPQCKALRTCCSDFLITTKWCCDQDVKVVPGAVFTKKSCNRCGLLLKGGGVVATSPLALRWMCDSPRTGCAWRITPIYMRDKQAIIEWSWCVISVVACCHGVKLCGLATRAFRSQQYLRYVLSLLVKAYWRYYPPIVAHAFHKWIIFDESWWNVYYIKLWLSLSVSAS